MKTFLNLLALLSFLLLVTLSSITFHPKVQREAEIGMCVVFGVFLASVSAMLWRNRKRK